MNHEKKTQYGLWYSYRLQSWHRVPQRRKCGLPDGLSCWCHADFSIG
jgi:hypothetical protein